MMKSVFFALCLMSVNVAFAGQSEIGKVSSYDELAKLLNTQEGPSPLRVTCDPFQIVVIHNECVSTGHGGAQMVLVGDRWCATGECRRNND